MFFVDILSHRTSEMAILRQLTSRDCSQTVAISMSEESLARMGTGRGRTSRKEN